MFGIQDRALLRKYREHTMIQGPVFIENLRLVRKYAPAQGAVVECGVWRGGMSAAIAEVLGSSREYYLFDSFRGLPPAKQIDGPAALAWQSDTQSPTYFNNCRAEINEARCAMNRSGVSRVHIVPGWFSDTLPTFPMDRSIAVLRLDSDWYESTMQCLESLFHLVTDQGLVIIDDYYVWDGCARAVHDFLSKSGSLCRLRQSKGGVCFMIKTGVKEG